MKINVRIFLITFFIIALFSIISIVSFYTAANRIIKDQNNQSLLNSASDFVFSLESEVEELKSDFNKINFRYSLNKVNLDSTAIDFIVIVDDDFSIQEKNIKTKSSMLLNFGPSQFNEFITENSNLLLFHTRDRQTRTIFYGKMVDQIFLNNLAKKNRAEIAFVSSDVPQLISNIDVNNHLYSNLTKAYNELKFKNNFDISWLEFDDYDLFTTIYKSKTVLETEQRQAFLIFDSHIESAHFRSDLQMLTIVIAISAIFLTIIFILIFTTKFRKQIGLLSAATEITREGDLDHRVTIISKDELGELGKTFNLMLDKIQLNESEEKEYSDVIQIVNQNPSLDKISEAVLNKLLEVLSINFGAIYLNNNGELQTLASKGLSMNTISVKNGGSIYSNVINKQEVHELYFESDLPVLKTASIEIKIKYSLVFPIIYNKKVIAIIEFASEKTPRKNPKVFIENIADQFAIGLNNAMSYHQLQNLVGELKELNEDYYKQNEQITDQNTELKLLHKALQEKAKELETQKESAIELTNVKSQFLANMSHELKTPLNSIIGLSELVGSDPDSRPKSKEKMSIILRNGKKLLALINNILEFSKIESGRLEIKKSSFLVSALFEEIYSSIEPLVLEKDISFEILLEGDEDYLILTDKRKLEQILLNLLGNAVKFTDEGVVKLIVKPSANKLDFLVVDSGIGITEEDQRFIFNEFHQTDFGSTKKFQGAGLGLAICKRFADLLEGTITVKSKLEKGSTFTLSLNNIVIETVPLNNTGHFSTLKTHSAKSSDDGRKVIDAAPEEEKKELLINKKHIPKILVVDDDSDTRFTVGEILNSVNMEVLFARDGVECLNVLESMIPDLILLDIMMPNMDGFETIKRIRKRYKKQNIVVAALTAQAMLDDQEIIKQNGFNDLITKPIVRSYLLSKVSNLLSSEVEIS
ncbi:MAG: response regulator [Bacteroidetes bacterium]|nr:response regulator [Bacteroidota bacterium]